MTPEELNRTIEFIIQSQARLAAAQEQDHEERFEFQKESRGFDRRLASLLEMQTQLLESQTRRLNAFEEETRAVQKRHEETQRELHEQFLEFMRETRDWQQRFQTDAQKKHEEAVAWLQRILEKLTDRLN